MWLLGRGGRGGGGGPPKAADPNDAGVMPCVAGAGVEVDGAWAMPSLPRPRRSREMRWLRSAHPSRSVGQRCW